MSYGNYMDVGRMDELGRIDSPLHRLDARGKILATMVFVISVMSFGRYEVSALMPLFIYPFALIAVGRMPAGYIFKKVAIALPFAFFVGIFNPLMDQEPVCMVGSLAVSGGWLSFASIMLRFVLTVSAALILVASTGIYRLCAGLERMGVPGVFAVQLLFLYRYFFVIGNEGSRMMRSVELRSVVSAPMRLRIYGALTGHLLLRSIDRAQRIYRAMVARGFSGEIRGMSHSRAGVRDFAFLTGWVVFCIVVRWFNMSELMGSLLLRS